MTQAHTDIDLAQTCGTDPRIWDEETGMLFGEPWQAQIFAMTVALNEAGQFEWSEWAGVFSKHRKASARNGMPDTVDTYYDDWLNALEEIASIRSLATGDEQHLYKHAWEHAAERTPHGLPIFLQEADFEEARSHHRA
ncbi:MULTISPECIES: nitrile hydratase accessory protein [unclassified Rhizobium]|uniref:nitrile hydratase accessory protein n=1 Tax=unclassified Rhizobium TaxID=2613769 RepID=UPI001784674A|nr:MULTISPECIES: nitrile hydratase accessory protein [unclassified Rhizobium]MBD8688362.1 nitrile hydratase accessory protein [Rhizobium sp. CFBP 13644]MBD8692817.1 nitrile hydratase accessory protein [Rhizobium sp. CFBP 13717]